MHYFQTDPLPELGSDCTGRRGQYLRGMASDWDDADRRAIKLVVVWAVVLLGGTLVRGVIAEAGDTQPAVALTLSVVWIGGTIAAILWTRRQRKTRR